ncbi:MAG: long-chain fatty acid--CoA ligase [Myxococcota bacterium]
MSAEARATLLADLLAFVREPEPERFGDLARRILAWQAEALAPFGRLVETRGGLPDDWRDAPLVPTDLFRDVDLCAAPADADVEAIFRTSGTTAGRRGARRVPDLTLYHAEMEAPFVRHVLAGDRSRRPWLSLVPPLSDAPDSSLSHMVSTLAEDLADRDASRWTMTPDGLDVEATADAFAEASRAGRPVVVLTTSFALVHLLDAAPDLRAPLPEGSRMMLTGGFKGRSRALSEDDLLEALEDRLGLPAGAVVPEYGMTELTSQAYGRPLEAPPWLRLRVVDPVTQRDLAAGEEGLVACFDLLNLDNVSPILTGDLGVLDADGRLTLHGRAPGTVLRGCSLTAEELGVVGT